MEIEATDLAAFETLAVLFFVMYLPLGAVNGEWVTVALAAVAAGFAASHLHLRLQVRALQSQ